MTALDRKLREKRILITGGLGMIGSTIACMAVRMGARVTIADACIEPFGANHFNIREIRDDVELKVCDIRDREAMGPLLANQDIIYNLAAQVSHNDSMENPILDAEINYFGHLNILEGLRAHNRDAVVFHAGSRLQYGRILHSPVSEDHPLHPLTPYALNKNAAENLYDFYHRIHGIPSVLFRIANPYGPRSQMRHSKYSIVNWMIRQAMDEQTVSVFGDGAQVRDYIYVEELAEIFVRAAIEESCRGEVFNVGSGIGTSFKEMATTVVSTVGKGTCKTVPWPANYVNVETGDYVSDITKLKKHLGWEPSISLSDGIHRTHAFYDQHSSEYW